MKHTQKVPHFEGDAVLLAQEMGDLYYDSLAELLHLLAEKIANDARADAARGRERLAQQLNDSSRHLAHAAQHIEQAWQICKPFVAAHASNSSNTKPHVQTRT